MKIDDKRQLPFQVGKLTGQLYRLEQLIAQLHELIPVSRKMMPLLIEQELNLDPNAYPADPISLKDAARLLGVHQSFVCRIIKQGSLRSWNLPGGHKRVSKADVLALPEPCQDTPPPTPGGERRSRRMPVRKEMSGFTKATLDRFGIVTGEEESHEA